MIFGFVNWISGGYKLFIKCWIVDVFRGGSFYRIFFEFFLVVRGVRVFCRSLVVICVSVSGVWIFFSVVF